MNAIIGLTHLVLKTELSSQQRGYLRLVQDSSRLLLTIINDILDFSKIEAGKMELESVDFILPQVIDQVSNIFKEKAAEKSIALFSEIDRDVPLSLRGDPFRIGQVLINLISNGIKFTREGQVAIRISMGKKPSPGFPGNDRVRLIFSVQDSGIGIAPEKIGHLFRPFTQADGSVTREYGGTGLGLSICERLVTLMNGSIGVESEVGRGSRFYFDLLIERPNEEKPYPRIHAKSSKGIIGLYDRQEPIPSCDAIDPDPLEMAGMADIRGARILLVEDNEINRDVATALLARADCIIEIAENGSDAINMIRAHAGPAGTAYDAVLMDIQMPVMDGVKATRIIRDDPALVHLPIIAMTAHALKGDREACLDAGMDDYVSKPINERELYQALVKWIKPGNGKPRNVASQASDRAREPGVGIPAIIPGIDVTTGLRQVGGNPVLFRNILESFERTFGNGPDDVKKFLAENDVEKMKQLIHSIKGVSGNIGANDLFQAARALEPALQEGGNSTPVPLVHAFIEELTRVLASLKKIDWEIDLGSADPGNEALNREQVSKLIKEMAFLLERSSSRARHAFVELKKILCIPRLSEHIIALENALQRLDTENGMRLLGQIAEDLDISLQEEAK